MSKARAKKIAAILYTLRDCAEKPADVPKVFKKVRDIGYLNIQVSGGIYSQMDAAEIRKMADDAGLSIISSHIGFPDMQEDLEAVVDRVKTYGSKYVAVPSIRPEKATAGGWRKVAKAFDRVGAKLRKKGIRLQYHNHAFEFEKFGIKGGKGGTTAHEILMKETRRKNLQAELDVAWVGRGGYDPAAYLASINGRADQIHAKDWGIVDGQEAWRAVGEGGLNWKAICKAARASGVKTYIVEQDTCPVTNDPFKSIAISFDNLMQMSL